MLRLVAALRVAELATQAALRVAAQAASHGGSSWAEIGEAAGFSQQNAHKRWAGR